MLFRESVRKYGLPVASTKLWKVKWIGKKLGFSEVIWAFGFERGVDHPIDGDNREHREDQRHGPRPPGKRRWRAPGSRPWWPSCLAFPRADHDPDVVAGDGQQEQDRDDRNRSSEPVLLGAERFDVLPDAEGDHVDHLGPSRGQKPDLVEHIPCQITERTVSRTKMGRTMGKDDPAEDRSTR